MWNNSYRRWGGNLFRLALIAEMIAGLAPQAAQADDKDAMPIAAAVVKFKDGTESGKGTADKVGDLLAAELASAKELLLVERDDMDRILKEHQLNLSGAVAADEAIRVGQLTGARLLITGSVIDTGSDRYLVAKIISTETSRVLGASAKGKVDDSLAELVEKVAAAIVSTVHEKGSSILPKAESREHRLGRLKKSLDGARPAVMVKISESHTGAPRIDPAAETEVTAWCQELGIKTIDPVTGKPSDAEYLITGEGLSELAGRHGGLASVRARLELKVVNRKTGEIVAVDRQMVRTLDSTEILAGKAGLQQAAATLSERLLPKIVAAEKPAKNKKK